MILGGEIAEHSNPLEVSEFAIGALTVATRLELAPEADRLTVVLNAYCDRIDVTPPAFVHWPEADPAFGHILRISDPSLLLSDWQKGACFHGTEEDDAIPGIVAHCRDLAWKLGVTRKEIVYFGNSGAGFGALQCAILDGVSIAIATNPLIDLGLFADYNFGNAGADLFRRGASLAELSREYPERFSVIAALRRATENGVRPCLG